MQKNRVIHNVRSLNLDQIFQVLNTTFTLSLGAVIVAMGFSLFQVPFNLAAGGITGVAIIVRSFIELPTGALYLILNLPLMIIGYRYLGRWQFLIRTILSVLVFSATTDFLSYVMPKVLVHFP
ncbi:MAG: YitT family protein, partial [Desulfobacterales bacterium]